MAGDDKGESFAALFEKSGGATARRNRFREGDRVEVTVVAIGRDAVFADLGAKQEGFFDLVDLAGPDGKLRVAVGGRIAAVVASSDESSGQVRLAPVFVRASGTDDEPSDPDEVVIPVARSAPLLVEGARVRGKVTGVERYGVFVQLTGTQGRGGRGLVPTSETATPRGADLKKHFVIGQDVDAKILNIAEDGKIRLSISALQIDEERTDLASFTEGEKKRQEQTGSKKGFGTLGDLLGKKKR